MSENVCVNVDKFVGFSVSQLGAVRLQQLKTELAEDLKEGKIQVRLFSLLWVPKCKTYTVPESNQNTQNSSNVKAKCIA